MGFVVSETVTLKVSLPVKQYGEYQDNGSYHASNIVLVSFSRESIQSSSIKQNLVAGESAFR